MANLENTQFLVECYQHVLQFPSGLDRSTLLMYLVGKWILKFVSHAWWSINSWKELMSFERKLVSIFNM